MVDDHQMFTESLVRLLGDETDVIVCGTAQTSGEAVETVRSDRPDVVLLDYQLPDADGATAARDILAVAPATRIVVLTGFADAASIHAALEAGCAGFLTKDRAASELIGAVRAAHAGESPISSDSTSMLLSQFSGASDAGFPSVGLTDREKEVLVLIGQGLSNQAIADEIFISVNTVRNHVQNVNRKLGASSKLEAASIARQRGLIARPQPRASS
ncbi:MAG: response regulator transcription factor [Acidimicrobiia bacterium]|nr:response regulator transcription factor [Acidimicrobiia bacterium]